jgi:hypothetical protein
MLGHQLYKMPQSKKKQRMFVPFSKHRYFLCVTAFVALTMSSLPSLSTLLARADAKRHASRNRFFIILL